MTYRPDTADPHACLRVSGSATAEFYTAAFTFSGTVKLRHLVGDVLVRIKPPPSDRLWWGFVKEPDMDLGYDHTLSINRLPVLDRQINHQIDQLIRKMVSSVFPFKPSHLNIGDSRIKQPQATRTHCVIQLVWPLTHSCPAPRQCDSCPIWTTLRSSTPLWTRSVVVSFPIREGQSMFLSKNRA